MKIDFGRHSHDYAKYRPGPPRSFYDRLDGMIPLDGIRALDLATGPGVIALELARRGSQVLGVDISCGQIVTAGRVAKERGLQDRTAFYVAGAEATGLADDSFDLVTAGQCWHWFDQKRVADEVLRILRPEGILAIVDYAYLAEHSDVARDSEALILDLNPTWTMAGSSNLFPERIDEVIRAGFRLEEAFCYDVPETFSHAGWRGRMRTCNGVGSGGLAPDDVLRFDEALRDLLTAKYPDPLVVQHRLWCVAARKPR